MKHALRDTQVDVRFVLYFCLVERTNWFLCYLTGSCPKFMFDDQLHMVIFALLHCSKITESTVRWSETRRDALKALISICSTVCGESDLGPGNFVFPQLCLYFQLSRLVVGTGDIVIQGDSKLLLRFPWPIIPKPYVLRNALMLKLFSILQCEYCMYVRAVTYWTDV
jgi:hypothetical protein